jgi:signal transduction histidine kinase
VVEPSSDENERSQVVKPSAASARNGMSRLRYRRDLRDGAVASLRGWLLRKRVAVVAGPLRQTPAIRAVTAQRELRCRPCLGRGQRAPTLAGAGRSHTHARTGDEDNRRWPSWDDILGGTDTHAVVEAHRSKQHERHGSDPGPGGTPRARPLGRVREGPALTTNAEIEAPGARIVAAADEARRRLECDLHDGAQQKLVSIALTIRQALAQARGTPAERLVAAALEQLHQALAELRDLAGRIHPAVLTERGLAPALEGLVARSPIPVELRAPHERAAPAAEAAIYFTVAEALTNVAKHAQATLARVQVDVEAGTLNALVADDGVGGADNTAGSGLRGLADRLNALGGTLTVESPIGGRTIIRARVPSYPGFVIGR